MRYSKEIKLKALTLLTQGQSKKGVAKTLKIPRSTLRYWVEAPLQPRDIASKYPPAEEHIKGYESEYSYLIGLYLGDGCISKEQRSYRLRIFLDNKYDKVILMAKKCLGAIFNKNKVSACKTHKGSNCRIVYVYSKELLSYFPTGKDKKHTRQITLLDWQKEVVKRHLEAFVRGLIHSDGSRYFCNTHKLIYYNFTNKSKDIIDLFTWACGELGIQYSERYVKQGEVYIVLISKRSEVQKMEMLGASKL